MSALIKGMATVADGSASTRSSDPTGRVPNGTSRLTPERSPSSRSTRRVASPLFASIGWRSGTRCSRSRPAGSILVSDGSKEVPEDAARRVLQEETGFRAGDVAPPGELLLRRPGSPRRRSTSLLATDLTPAVEDRRGPEQDERLILSWLPWREAVAAAESGRDHEWAKSVAGLFWLARLMDDGSLARLASLIRRRRRGPVSLRRSTRGRLPRPIGRRPARTRGDR